MMRNRAAMYLWLISLVTLGGLALNSNQKIQENITEPIRHTIETLEALSAVQEPQAEDVPVSLNVPEESADTPLQYIFPTPGVPPVSFWRPPLYEIPWAVSPNDHFLFSRPISADVVNWPLADYRYGYFFPSTEIVHTGIDIDAPRGSPVLAAAPGTVVWAGYGLYFGSYNEDDPYGIAVTIQHDFGWNDNRLLTVYAHMDRVDVQVGQRVELGEQLGIVGNTGNSTGPHLHFEVRVGTNSFYRTRNPELWLAPPQGWGVLVGQIRKGDLSFINYQDVYVRNQDTAQLWMVRTYGPSSINRDDFFQENLVLSDLPAGNYILYFTLDDTNHRYSFEINPGEITYFRFQENIGFLRNNLRIDIPEEWENVIFSTDFWN